MYIEGEDRAQYQLLPARLDDYVSQDATVRAIEAFVDGLDLGELGFAREVVTTGRPAYHPGDLLKLYIYGYLHQVRSSRRLEAETQRNLEVIWLMKALRPDFWTIAAFRREHAARFKGVLRDFNLLCRKLELFGAELVAIDGAKFKAVNGRARNYTPERLRQLLARVDASIEEYVKRLETADEQMAGVPKAPTKAQLEEKLSVLRERKARHTKVQEAMGDSREISLTDPDSRAQKKVGVGYNVQVAVDAKNHLIVAAEAVNEQNDLKQLHPMAAAAKEQLQVEKLQVVADAGYHSTDQLEQCEVGQIETYVATKQGTAGQAPGGAAVYPKTVFNYDGAADQYRCPAGQALPFVCCAKERGKVRRYYYNAEACAACVCRSNCTTGTYRKISRLQNEAVVDRQDARVTANPGFMQKRKAIVEHVFGTLRNGGHDTFLCRGLINVRAELALSALAYNLRRAINLLGAGTLLTALRGA